MAADAADAESKNQATTASKPTGWIFEIFLHSAGSGEIEPCIVYIYYLSLINNAIQYSTNRKPLHKDQKPQDCHVTSDCIMLRNVGPFFISREKLKSPCVSF